MYADNILHIHCVYMYSPLQKLNRQRAKRKRFRERQKAKKTEKWMGMRDEALRKRWRERNEKYQLDREQDIRENEISCNRKTEALASALEETAVNNRSASNNVGKINSCSYRT